MYIFLHGEDSYRLRQAVGQLRDRFLKKDPSGMNYLELDADGFDFSTFADAVRAGAFMAPLRFLIVRDVFSLLKAEKDDLTQFIKEEDLKNVIAFVESGSPDKRTGLWKALKKEAKVQEFRSLEGAALRTWVEREAERQGVVFAQGALDILLSLAGSDLWMVTRSLATLRGYCGGEPIGQEAIELFVKGEYSSTIFEALEALTAGRLDRAYQLIHEQFEQGQHPLYVFTMLVTQFRQLLILADLKERGVSSGDIASQSKLHPFVVQKLSPVLGRFSHARLQKIFSKLASVDVALKTGSISPMVAVDLLVAGLR